MIYHPRPGQRVTLRYRGPRRRGAPSMRDWTGLHLARGTVVVAGTGGGPLNALVELDDGQRAVVPRGHLFAGGAVDLDACPDGPPRRYKPLPCRCGVCAVCGLPKHMAIHGPCWGERPGTRPHGHEFEET